MTKPETTSYVLKDIPADLWDRVRHLAIDRKTSARQIMLDGLKKMLDEKKEVE
jgi:hypothetical protein